MSMQEKSTPMMEQYRGIRRRIPEDTILFFRLGDFYEMFFEDAKTASKILDIALTKRQQVPMCGVPYHAAGTYINRLIRAGKKVALCDQVEEPSADRKIVKRDITRVITPGTVLEEEQILQANRNNFLAGLTHGPGGYGLAFLDLSTGTFTLEACAGRDAVRDVLAAVRPAECVVPESLQHDKALEGLFDPRDPVVVTPHEDWVFDPPTARDLLTRHFQVHSLDGFGCRPDTPEVGAAGGVLHYVSRELHRRVDHIRALQVRHTGDTMMLDESTVDHLELVGRRGGRGNEGTLLGVLDDTRSPMGGRLLRDWVVRPLIRADQVRARHDRVEVFTRDRALLHALRDLLREVRDLERLIARLSAGSGNARDARAVTHSLDQLPALRTLLDTAAHPALAPFARTLEPRQELVDLVHRALVDEPPATLREGGVIRPGYHEELDLLRTAAAEGRQWLATFQAREQERTGIKTLKVRHNKVFGYYIEISKAQSDHAPEDYTRKQTLVNAERFTTPALKEYEHRILGARDRAITLEQELFAEVRTALTAHTAAIQEAARSLAELDVLTTLADRALRLNYVRPVITEGDTLVIREGRHPVVEQLQDAEPFVPNDTQLNGHDHQILIITGPNMAGKSTYIRQVALITVMAQIGSFIPATSAEIGLVDRVFTRVGASDDLARGRSTFMVEMQETANILNHATARSLIVLDEIGRGTSTFDGISIAWAVAEHLHNQTSVKARTLFATHYHELTDMALTLPGIKNYNVLVREKGNTIAFLRRIVPGAADQSYGIQVARLAGLPDEVIERAREILENLEEGEHGESGMPVLAKRRPKRHRDSPQQMTLL